MTRLDPPRSRPRIAVELTADSLSVAAACEGVQHPECGGTGLFVGTVRNHHEGAQVTGLAYEAWEERARDLLMEVAREVTDEFSGVRAVHVAHRLGDLAVGEASVVVAASAPHRDEAIAAAHALIDRVKERVPIWKREYLADGSSRWTGLDTPHDG
ncbi:MAG: molybdenum cofactor biosynthesis protein MoaE [Nitriliruptorales bacterium]